ncbi:DUF2142 domain-containing protein [Bifidobacterium panos]|uniref:DUF2142 domain-containing protein n=1 Tax=Bifidobacterium panos TaxID=2675321 RepID=A0ABX1SZA2_9BIFI|nr:DUF2142 domain-containing protein [Bifidobacterium sp. DSM 109963]NMN02502.1 hypothetical protein [Bifidobacterium sp. DSM 109963]
MSSAISSRGTDGKSRRPIDVAQAAVVCLGLIFSLCFAFITPPFWGNDNMSHYSRAYQIAQGDLFPQLIDYTEKPDVPAYGGELPKTLWKVFELSNAQRSQAAESGSGSAHNPAFHRTAELETALNTHLHASSDTETVWFNNTAAYSPVPYLIPAAGIAVADALNVTAEQALLIPTLLNALFFIFCAWLAVWILKDSKFKWLVVAFTLFPPALAQAVSSVTADTCTNALCMLLFALIVKALLLKQQLTRLDTVVFAATAVLLPLCKPTYGFLTLVLLLTPNARFAFRRLTNTCVKWASVGLGFALWVAWTLVSASTSLGMPRFRSDYWEKSFGTSDQLHALFANPLNMFRLVANTFVDQDDNINHLQLSALSLASSPTGILLFSAALVLVAGACERVRFAKKSHMWLLILALLAAFGSSLASIYCTFNPVGNSSIEGVYARYFFPITPFVVLLILATTSLRFATHRAHSGLTELEPEPNLEVEPGLADVPMRSRVLTVAVPILLAAALLATTLKYYGQIWGL